MIKVHVMVAAIMLASSAASNGCDAPPQPVADSGVSKASAHVSAGSDGLTTEQRNIKDRLEQDNKPGSIKHLYVISAYSGQVILYSTVRGKVTSGGKRLTPRTVSAGGNDWGIPVHIGGSSYTTSEVIEDDGTYGDSMNYLYWFDQKGVYHQHYVTGGQIVHISSEPISVKSIVLNLEVQGK